MGHEAKEGNSEGRETHGRTTVHQIKEDGSLNRVTAVTEGGAGEWVRWWGQNVEILWVHKLRERWS